MNEPEFLKVKPGDTVLVGENEIAKVLSFVGGARDPNVSTLFQVSNVYSVKSNLFMVRKSNKFCLNLNRSKNNV